MCDLTDLGNVLVKGDVYPTLVLVDLQTEGEDLIDFTFVHLYRIQPRQSENKTLTSIIKESEGSINIEYTIQFD